MDLVASVSVVVGLSLAREIKSVIFLRKKYRDFPISLADACLVRMSELYNQSYVATLDADFSIYRRLGREPISLLTPPSRTSS